MQLGDAANPLWNPWANDRKLLETYRARARGEKEEMTCAAQAAEILSTLATSGETLLDAGCGAGYYYWSFYKRGLGLEYNGLDYTPEMIEAARAELCPRARLSPDAFSLGAIENLDREFDNVVCFNVLTNSPHYALPLERLLACTRKRLLLRENLADALNVSFTPDPYLDEDKRHIRVYHNAYPLDEVMRFIKDAGFRVTRVRDQRSNDGTEMVVDIPHTWRILVAERTVG